MGEEQAQHRGNERAYDEGGNAGDADHALDGHRGNQAASAAASRPRNSRVQVLETISTGTP
jgi:hypothetical protein